MSALTTFASSCSLADGGWPRHRRRQVGSSPSQSQQRRPCAAAASSCARSAAICASNFPALQSPRPGANEADAGLRNLPAPVLAARRLHTRWRRVREPDREHLLAIDHEDARRRRRARRDSCVSDQEQAAPAGRDTTDRHFVSSSRISHARPEHPPARTVSRSLSTIEETALGSKVGSTKKARAAFRRPSNPVASVGFGRGASCLTRGWSAARNARPLRVAMAIPQWVPGTRLYPLVPPLPVLLESVTPGPLPFRGNPSVYVPTLRRPLSRVRSRGGDGDVHDTVVAHRDRIGLTGRYAGNERGGPEVMSNGAP